MRVLYDLSPPLSPDIAVWPGDVPYRRDVSVSFATGGNLDLSSITTTLHVGAHADAPSHYRAGAPGIAARPLDRYLGPCEVMRVSVAPGTRIEPRDLPRPPSAARVLLRTDTFVDPTRFDRDFAALSPELVHHLADAAVVLVGIDTPSVDPFDDAVLHSHRAVADRDLAILEGLVLRDVPDGHYTLIALPLPLVDADASPVRAVLVG